MSKDRLVDWLGKTSLFGTLDPEERRTVALEMREVQFAPGQIVFGRGDPRVRLSVLTAEGRELSFAHAEPGQIFGEIAVLDGGVRTADATAVSKVIAHSLSKSALMRLVETSTRVREAVVRFLCQRVREADQQLEGIALYPIEARLARFFLAAARQKPEAKSMKRVTLDMAISQSELALLIGASRPKVNAALALLQDSGAIERNDKTLICNIEELENLAGTA
jgi:CRP/FNR family cyclic AMP-dependent transcriptional regulator